MATSEKRFVRSSFEDALAAVRNVPGAEAYFAGDPSPDELNEIYSQGYQGVDPDSVSFEWKQQFNEFMATMPKLYDIFPWAKGIGKGKIACPYLATLTFDENWGGDEAQTVGSCTVHGNGNACEMDHANDAIMGETKWKGRLVKENVYRSRGRNSHGWSCRAPAQYVSTMGKGGLLYRKVYTGPNGETIDLSKLNEKWASNGSAGVPLWLEEMSRANKVKWVCPISEMGEYMDALYLAFGLSVCSGQGFSSETDEYGLAAAKGSWSHAMAHTGYVDTEWAHARYGNMIGSIQQSWGHWNRQNGKPEGVPRMAVGQFYGKSSVIANMVRGGDTFAMCGVWGFDRQDWQVYNVGEMVAHLRSSTVQDYYKTRQERSSELLIKAMDTGYLAL